MTVQIGNNKTLWSG